MRYFAVALGRRGITVNVISPGATEDNVVSRLPAEVFQAIKAWHDGSTATPVHLSEAMQDRMLDR